MKAISLWEPWASLMRTHAKKNETRSWYTSYRGPLLICASKRKMTKDEIEDLYEDQIFKNALGLQNQTVYQIAIKLPSFLNYGNAVAIVNLVDCKNTEQMRLLELVNPVEYHCGNYAPGRYAWITEPLHTIKPFPVLGKQGFFDVDDKLINMNIVE